MTTGRFDGKVALITGAGSGIGRSVTLRLLEEGARVLGVDIDADRLAETGSLAGVTGAPAGSYSGRQVDVGDPASCAGAVAAAVEQFGRLDVLGNVAGIARADNVTDVSVESYRKLMAVNVDACFFLCQAAIPHLLETGGNIVNIASNAGLMGQAYTVVYCMTKGAVVQMTRALAMEFVKTPLRVNAIAPGGTSTNLSAGFQIPHDADFALMQPYMGFRDMSDPSDIAAVFAFVASDEARAIHGAILSADNGITAG